MAHRRLTEPHISCWQPKELFTAAAYALQASCSTLPGNSARLICQSVAVSLQVHMSSLSSNASPPQRRW